MSNQRLDEWRVLDERALEYHRTQWSTPKESTKAFAGFVAEQCESTNVVMDLACGSGAVTAYLAKAHPKSQFIGLDVSPELVEIGVALAAAQGIGNLSFRTADWFKLPKDLPSDTGVVSTQTLSWLPELQRPLELVLEGLRPRWLAVSSLFYEGDISCTIDVLEHRRSRSSFYNCYAIPEVERIAQSHGYHVASAEPFEIPINIPSSPDRDLMGTRTVTVIEDDGRRRRLQISGPLLMNWHHLLIEPYR